MKINDEHKKAIIAAGMERLQLERISVDGYGEVMRRKEDLPASLPDIASLRDFGGCYLVHGRYLLHATQVNKLAFASMIDMNPTPEFLTAVEAAKKVVPSAEFETIRGDFREPSLVASLRETDASLLYEVILHQENYVEVLKNVCAKTRKYLCLAQPCIREELFALPAAAVMLQFYDETLKDLLRKGSFWPKEPRKQTFTTAHWMWGQTTSHLIEIMRGFGWALNRGLIVDNICGLCWEYPLLVFAKQYNSI
jgi:hypothetical protein